MALEPITNNKRQPNVVTWGSTPAASEMQAPATTAGIDMGDVFSRKTASLEIRPAIPGAELAQPGARTSGELAEVNHQLGNLLTARTVRPTKALELIQKVADGANSSRQRDEVLHSLARLMVASGLNVLLREKIDLDNDSRKMINALIGNHLHSAEIEHDNLVAAQHRMRHIEKPVYAPQRLGSDRVRLSQVALRLSSYLHREIFADGSSPYQGIALQPSSSIGDVDEFSAYLLPKDGSPPIPIAIGYSMVDADKEPYSSDFLFAGVLKNALEEVGIDDRQAQHREWPAYMPMLTRLAGSRSSGVATGAQMTERICRLAPTQIDGTLWISVSPEALAELLDTTPAQARRAAEQTLRSIGLEPAVRTTGQGIQLPAEQAKLLLVAEQMNNKLRRAFGEDWRADWQAVRMVNGEPRFVLPSDMEAHELDALGRMRQIRLAMTPGEGPEPVADAVLAQQLRNLTGEPARPQQVVGAKGDPEAWALSIDQARRLFSATFPSFSSQRSPTSFNAQDSYWSARLSELVYEKFESDVPQEAAEAEAYIRATLSRWGFDGKTAELITTPAGAQALVASNGDIVVTAIRGTDDLQAAVTDANILKDELDLSEKQLAKPSCQVAEGVLPKGEPGELNVRGVKIKVHSGFQTYTESLMPAVLAAIGRLNQDNTLPTTFTGHSLGGASNKIAYLMADAAGVRLGPSHGIEGARSVDENGALLAAARGLARQTFNMAVLGDPVPGVPPNFLGFRDFGLRMVIDPDTDRIICDMTSDEYFSEAQASRLQRHTVDNLLPILARTLLERAILPPPDVPPMELVHPLDSEEAQEDPLLAAFALRPEAAPDGRLMISGDPVVHPPREYRQRDAHTLDAYYGGWESFGNSFADWAGSLGRRIDGISEAREGNRRRAEREKAGRGTPYTIQDLQFDVSRLDAKAHALLFPPGGPMGYVPFGEPIDVTKMSQVLELQRELYRGLALDSTQKGHYVSAPELGPGAKAFVGGPLFRVLQGNEVWVDLDSDPSVFAKQERLLKYGMTALLNAGTKDPTALRRKWGEILRAVGPGKLAALLGDSESGGTLRGLRARFRSIPKEERADRIAELEPKIQALLAQIEATQLFVGVEEKYQPVWQSLVRRYIHDQPLVEIRQPESLRGELGSDYNELTDFEQEASANILDLHERRDLLEHAVEWETMLVRDLLPDLEKNGRVGVLESRKRIRYLLTPPWLTEQRFDSNIADGWDAHPNDVLAACKELVGRQTFGGRFDSEAEILDFVDTANALNLDILSGTESHWMALVTGMFNAPMSQWPNQPERSELWGRLENALVQGWISIQSDPEYVAGQYKRKASFDALMRTTLRALDPESRQRLSTKLETAAAGQHDDALANLRHRVAADQLRRLTDVIEHFTEFLQQGVGTNVVRRYTDQLAAVANNAIADARAGDAFLAEKLEQVDRGLQQLGEALEAQPQLASQAKIAGSSRDVREFVAELRDQIAALSSAE